MSCHTLFKIRFNIVLVSATSFQILLLQFCINFFSFSSRTAQPEFRWGQEFFLLQNVQPGSWAHPASYSMDTRVKHSDREVYHSSPPSAEVMNEWRCSSTAPVWLHGLDRVFSHLSLACYMPRPSRRRNEVAMQCEAPIIQIFACCYLPGPHIQPPHHSTLQPPQSASPTHQTSFACRDNNREWHF